MTLPVSLAAAAVTLRRRNATLFHDHAVADLIDGTLKLHPRCGPGAGWDEHCGEDGEDYPCPTLQLLVPVVRAFLPDWNPDE